MPDLVASGALQVFAVAFGVGVVVGLTGMGGGALMTPALIFLGVPPTSAVANDLVAAALNKSAGAAVHLRQGAPHLSLVKWLVIGSVPTALIGSFAVHLLGPAHGQENAARLAIGLAILLTAATYTLRIVLEPSRIDGTTAKALGDFDAESIARPLPTLAVGALGGLLVGITSVGSGSLIMVALLLLYPALSVVRLVGTDLVQAVPLVLAAAIGHVLVTGVEWAVLIPLVVGGTPGTMLGARLTPFLPSAVVRRCIVIVLTMTGLALLQVPHTMVGGIGIAMVAALCPRWPIRHLATHRRVQPSRTRS